MDQMPQRKNSTDALRTAVQHSKAALKKGLKIGSTGLTVLRRPVSNPAAAEVGVVTPEKVEKLDLKFLKDFLYLSNSNFVANNKQ